MRENGENHEDSENHEDGERNQDGENAGERQPGEGPQEDSPEDRVAPRSGLSAQERAVLALERRNWPEPGAKERAAREELGLAPVRYYQLLNALLDDPYALEHDPVTIHRLLRARQARRENR